ncbi:hypothetical protein [Xanthobacter wiegelii]|uniref:hypothetical protein n=1 Tax=Xanthobacter wiegelii TaxID=3119913 RepID=UPI00372B45DF
MTDLRPRLPRDRDGIAIDAMAIGDSCIHAVKCGYASHIGPYDSNVIVRISTFSVLGVDLLVAASQAAFTGLNDFTFQPETMSFADGLMAVPAGTVEYISLPKGESLYFGTPYTGNVHFTTTIMK